MFFLEPTLLHLVGSITLGLRIVIHTFHRITKKIFCQKFVSQMASSKYTKFSMCESI